MKALDITKHKTHLTNILIDIYKESVTGAVLGFKGGTSAMLFYQLPRFSVDLDFDLIPRYEADSPQLKLFIEKKNKINGRLPCGGRLYKYYPRYLFPEDLVKSHL